MEPKAFDDNRPNAACPFCRVSPDRIVECGSLAFAMADAFPVSRGHILVIPKRHVASFFSLTGPELAEIGAIIQRQKERIDSENHPDGYNIGVNVGREAGQTIMHVHVHLIPRYKGDLPDPTGGVRGVIPDKRRY